MATSKRARAVKVVKCHCHGWSAWVEADRVYLMTTMKPAEAKIFTGEDIEVRVVPKPPKAKSPRKPRGNGRKAK